MEKYPLHIVEDHLLVELPSGLTLVDSGSPRSLSYGPALQLLGREFPASTSMSFVLDSVSEAIGTEVAFLMGNDVLTECTLEIDWPGRAATFGPARAESGYARTADHNATVPVAMLLGVPTIKVMHGGKTHTAVLDTGAPISFAPSGMTSGLRTIGSATTSFRVLARFQPRCTASRSPSKARRSTSQSEDCRSCCRPPWGWSATE